MPIPAGLGFFSLNTFQTKLSIFSPRPFLPPLLPYCIKSSDHHVLSPQSLLPFFPKYFCTLKPLPSSPEPQLDYLTGLITSSQQPPGGPFQSAPIGEPRIHAHTYDNVTLLLKTLQSVHTNNVGYKKVNSNKLPSLLMYQGQFSGLDNIQ